MASSFMRSDFEHAESHMWDHNPQIIRSPMYSVPSYVRDLSRQ